MNFRRFVEALDTLHALTYSQSKMKYSGTFDIGSWSYRATAVKNAPDDDHWSVIFTGKDNDDDDSDPYGLRSMSKLSKEQSKLAPASVKVFAGVGQFIDNFIKTISPQSFEFEAAINEPSRVRLYDNLAPRLAYAYGYELSRHRTGAFVTYHFEKVLVNQ